VDTLGIEAGFVLSTQRVGFNFSRLEIRLNFSGSSQIVADHMVDIGELERRILLDYCLGGSPIAKSPQDGV